jgi:hypothetical protein
MDDFYMVGTGQFQNNGVFHYDGSDWLRLSGGNLVGIWGSGVDDIFAVGDAGLIRHFDGNSWADMDGSTGSYLRDVWGVADGRVVAVGTGGKIIQYRKVELPYRSIFLPVILKG